MSVQKLNIAILCGGYSSEAEVSRRSALVVYDAIDQSLYNPTLVDISPNGWFTSTGAKVDIGEFSLNGKRFDYALNVIHGTPGENGVLAGYFALLGIPHSSCDVGVASLTFNKSLTKLSLGSIEGMNVAREIIHIKGEPIDSAHICQTLGLPLFVKPNQSGSSFGVSKVKTQSELIPAIHKALMECDSVVMEEFIDGVEISQGVMVCGDEQFVFPITELRTTNEFFDTEAKYTDGKTEEITPAQIDSQLAQVVSNLTLRAYNKLNCRGVVRIDYILRHGTTPYMVEVNTIPGMSRNSIIPQQWNAIGLSITDGLTKIIESTRTK